MSSIEDLRVKIFADGADVKQIVDLYGKRYISGFTTNPTLMRKAGIQDYRQFAKLVLEQVTDLPISFEVFADDFDEMEEQAIEIASWGENVNVKIPITNTEGRSSRQLLERLAAKKIKLNVTAIMTERQIQSVIPALAGGPDTFISVFAGRIADTGRDPLPLMRWAVAMLEDHSNLQLIWASPRELLNVVQAHEIGCHVITVTGDILKKLELIGKDLGEYSLETVKMFYDDARKAGYSLDRAMAARS